MLSSVIAIVQARMGSSRLPGKSLAPIAGRPALALMLERAKEAKTLDGILVATTVEPADDQVAEVARAAGAAVFRGSEDDVLGRYDGAATESAARTVVRLTSDCVLIDPAVIDRVVRAFIEADGEIDLATNAPPKGRTYPDGMDVEVFSREALERAARTATAPRDREHVTSVFHAGGYRVRVVHLERPLGHVRLTIDHPQDLARIRELVDALLPGDPRFTLDDILALLAARGELDAAPA